MKSQVSRNDPNEEKTHLSGLCLISKYSAHSIMQIGPCAVNVKGRNGVRHGAESFSNNSRIYHSTRK